MTGDYREIGKLLGGLRVMSETGYFTAGDYPDTIYNMTPRTGKQEIRMEDAIEDVKQMLNVPNLKEKQLEAIRAVLDRKHIFALLPTGYGKTLCFVFPPLVLDKLYPDAAPHITIVISPLRSLMMNQVETLTSMNVKCMAIRRKDEMDSEMIKDLKAGNFNILLTSPEAILTDEGKKLLMSKPYKDRLRFLVFDESHCITQWGDEFRPVYKEVSILRSLASKATVATFTGTCTAKMMKDILSQLLLSDQVVQTVALLPDRPNLFIDIKKTKNFQKEIQWYTESLAEHGSNAPKAIVYCRSMQYAASVYAHLMKVLGDKAWMTPENRDPSKRLVDMYHSASLPEDQTRVTSEFPKADSTIRVVIATIAFGLGVDIPDVRYIFHVGSSRSTLSYWQEIGRCCRDGEQGQCYLYLVPYSLDTRKVDEDIKSLCEDDTRCFRIGLLENLVVPGMDTSPLTAMRKRKHCNKKKCETCVCALCTCCSRCKKTCPCSK